MFGICRTIIITTNNKNANIRQSGNNKNKKYNVPLLLFSKLRRRTQSLPYVLQKADMDMVVREQSQRLSWDVCW
jgi:hypothetical protein